MNVYIEYAFLDNLTMDCLILLLATTTLGQKAKWHRILLGGVVGSVTAILTFTLDGVLLYFAKFLSLMLMCIATVGFGKRLFWCVVTTFGYTFLIGGAIVGLFNLGQPLAGGVIYQSDIPLFCYFFAILLAVVVVKLIVAYANDVKRVLPNVHSCQIVLDGCHNVKALYDSGNSAVCNGLPLCFVSKRFADIIAKRMLFSKTRDVQVSTIAGKSTVIATQGQVIFDGETIDAYFAIGKMSPLYDVILANSICPQKTQNQQEN